MDARIHMHACIHMHAQLLLAARANPSLYGAAHFSAVFLATQNGNSTTVDVRLSFAEVFLAYVVWLLSL